MNIGRLDKRIKHQIRTVTTDDWNHENITWSTRATICLGELPLWA